VRFKLLLAYAFGIRPSVVFTRARVRTENPAYRTCGQKKETTMLESTKLRLSEFDHILPGRKNGDGAAIAPCEPVKTRRLTLDVPEGLYRAIKLHAAQEGETMAEMLREVLMEQFG